MENINKKKISLDEIYPIIKEKIEDGGTVRIPITGTSMNPLLDWGRGVWTRDNIWNWGAACNNINGHEVPFNIGYGFGDNSLHSENAIFYDGELHKLDRVTINIPLNENSEYDYLKEWNISSNDKRFEMTFTPLINRSSLTDIKILISDQNQVFGKFNGFLVLNDGKKIEVKDFLGFIERVRNKW